MFNYWEYKREILALHPVRKFVFLTCPDGGIGRRVGLKHQCPQGHAGSTPALGTQRDQDYFRSLFLRLPAFIVQYRSQSSDSARLFSLPPRVLFNHNMVHMFHNLKTFTLYDRLAILLEVVDHVKTGPRNPKKTEKT